MTNPFDGSGQITSIGAMIAVIAYLRNLPMKELREFVAKRVDSNADNTRVLRFLETKKQAYNKLMLHSLCQIGLMTFIVLLSIRILISVFVSTEASPRQDFSFYLDRTIAILVLLASIGYLIIHLFIDIPEFFKASEQKSELVQEIESKTAPTQPNSPA